MNRILVGQTIGRGYRFLFRRFFAILGLSWLPALALGVVGYLWLVHFASDVATFARSPNGLYWLGLDLAGIFSAVAFFGATIGVPVTREALGLHDETVFAHFVVGRRELRLFFALLRLGVLLLSAAILLTLALGLVARLGLPFVLAKMGAASEATAAWHGVPLRALVMGGMGLVLVSVLVFLTLRLGFFLMPIAAIEERARVTRAWILSGRNFWRLLVVTFALAAPIDLLARGVEYALFGGDLQRLLPQALATRDFTALAQWMAGHAAIFAGIGATVLVLFTTLFAGAAAMVYRTLMPAADMAPVWQPSERESVDETPMLPAVPAMAAPPLDLSLGDHHAYVAEAQAPHVAEADTPQSSEAAVAVAPASAEPVPEILPEALAVHPAAEHAATSVAPPDAIVADHEALPPSGEPEHTVLELAPADEAPHQASAPESAPAAHTAEASAAPDQVQHAPTAEPVTDVIENILPTGDPETAPKERELEPAE